jgi:hypothetical protein
MLNLIMAAVLLLQAPPVDEKKVQELVGRFGSEDIAVRETATTELLAMGEGVLPLLEKFKEGADAETKARLGRIIADLSLPSRWAKEILESESGQGYQRLEQALRSKELDRKQAARIVTVALLTESATPEQRSYLMNLAQQHRLRDIWPAILQLLTRDDPGNENFVYVLQSLRPPREAAPALLKLIPKVQAYNASYQLLEIARTLKPERAAMEECIGAILDGDDMNLKSHATNMLQQGRYLVSLRALLKWWRGHPEMRPYNLREPVLRAPPGEALADVLELFKSADPEEVNLAIEYVGRQKVVAAAGALLKAANESPELRARVLQSFKLLRCEEEVRQWIAGKGGADRRAAIALAAELGWAGAGPEIMKSLDDADPGVRRDAAAAAGSLKVADAAARLHELIKDPDSGVRRAALLSLATIQGKGATKTVLAQLRSDDSDVQAAAVEALPFVDTDRVLAELATDEALGRPITKYALAFMIVRGGPATLHRVMTRLGAKLSADDLHAQIRLIQSVPGR